MIAKTNKIFSWISKRISEESIKTPSTLGNCFAPKMVYYYWKIRVEFNGNCLRQDNIFCIHGNVVHLYIVYELDTWSRDLKTDFTLSSCLFGAVKLTKKVDPDKYGYSSYGTGFHARSQFAWPDSEWGKMLFLELIVLPSILITEKKISWFMVKVQQMHLMIPQ